MKLSTLKILLNLAITKGVQKLQVMGDYHIVMDWLKYRHPPRNIYLKPLYDEVILILNSLNHVSFQHIYKERNMVVDNLSKEGKYLQEMVYGIGGSVLETT